MTTVTQLRRVVRRRLREELNGAPLRGAQLELLQIVETEPGIRVAAAAQALHLAGNTVSTMVNQLHADGLLRRAPDPDDRRAARLELTAAASERLALWRAARSELVQDGIGALADGDAAAIAAALPALARLTAVLADAARPRPDTDPAIASLTASAAGGACSGTADRPDIPAHATRPAGTTIGAGTGAATRTEEAP